MPSLAKQWLQAFNNIQYKYSGVVSLAKATELVERLEKDVDDIRLSLADSKKTGFVIVTIPETVPVEETVTLVGRLTSLQIPAEHMIVNRVVPFSECNYCQARRKEQQKHLRRIRKVFSGFKTREMPQFSSEIRGIADLERYANILYAKRAFMADLK